VNYGQVLHLETFGPSVCRVWENGLAEDPLHVCFFGQGPELHRGMQDFRKVGNSVRFGEKSVGAELVGGADVVFEVRTTEDDCGNDSVLRLGTQPAEKFKSVHSIHLQIGHDDIRLGIAIMDERRETAQVIDRFLTVPDDLEGARLFAAPAESDLEELSVVWVVFQQEQIELPDSMPHAEW